MDSSGLAFTTPPSLPQLHSNYSPPETSAEYVGHVTLYDSLSAWIEKKHVVTVASAGKGQESHRCGNVRVRAEETDCRKGHYTISHTICEKCFFSVGRNVFIYLLVDLFIFLFICSFVFLFIAEARAITVCFRFEGLC